MQAFIIYNGFEKADYKQFIDNFNTEDVVVEYDYNNMLALTVANGSLHIFNAININVLDKLLKELNNARLEETDLTEYRHPVGPIKAIKIFQRVNKLVDQGFNYKVEVLNVLEELLETLNKYETENAREVAEEIYTTYFANQEVGDDNKLVDAFNDLAVIGLGAIMKLGYDPECTLTQVAEHINSRRGEIVNGKFVKSKKEEDVKLWKPVKFEECRR